MIDPSLCGAIVDQKITDAVCLALATAGKEPLFRDAQPTLRGFGGGKTFLHQDTETALFGKPLPSWNQQRGTCTSQGTGRAFQHACMSVVSQFNSKVEWACEVDYGIARVQLGHGQFGQASPWGRGSCNDGCSGALLAQAYHDYGALPRGIYGTINLSNPREDLSILWGNSGCPINLLSLMAQYKAMAVMQCKSVEDVRDALAAHYGVAACGPYATEGERDQNGCIIPTNIAPGGHCEEISGVFVDVSGELRFVIQNSWGTNGPSGGGSWKLFDGREVIPAEGAAAVRPEAIQAYLKNGEIWVLAPASNLPNDQKPSEIT